MQDNNVTNFAHVVRSFRTNADSVYELLDFDRLVLDHVVGGLGELAQTLEELGHRNAARTVSNRVIGLQNIRQSDSLRPRYGTIFNQCVVLLVSYFGSAIHTLFREAVVNALNRGASVPAAAQELKLSWRDLSAADGPLEAMFADLLVTQKDISFQDMQSIARAFRDHLHVEFERGTSTNDIIVGQATRHVIVHAGGVVDAKMLRQIASATPRRLKPGLVVGEAIRFEPEEVRLLGATMVEYLENAAASTACSLGANV